MMTSTDAQTAALAVLDLARAGRFDEIRELFAASLRPMVTAAALQAAWDAELARAGPVVSVGAPVSDPADRAWSLVRVPVRFERGQLTLAGVPDPSGELAGTAARARRRRPSRRAVATAPLRRPRTALTSRR